MKTIKPRKAKKTRKRIMFRTCTLNNTFPTHQLDEKNSPDDCGPGKTKLRVVQQPRGRRRAGQISPLFAGSRQWFERCPAGKAGSAGSTFRWSSNRGLRRALRQRWCNWRLPGECHREKSASPKGFLEAVGTGSPAPG